MPKEFKIVYKLNTKTGRYVVDVHDDGFEPEETARLCDRALKVMQSHFQHEKPTQSGIN